MKIVSSLHDLLLGLILGAAFCLTIPPASARTITLVAFGDSLTAGYGLNAADAFPAKLEAALKAKGYEVRVINAGVSGDTTAAGLARLDWSISQEADGVILELGANDMLRGLQPADTRKSLDAILERLGERKLPVLFAGMLAAPNLGAAYAKDYNPVFPELAAKHGAIFYPFFLDGVVGDPALNLNDGMHPNPAGVDVIVERILPSVEELIARIQKD